MTGNQKNQKTRTKEIRNKKFEKVFVRNNYRKYGPDAGL